MKNLTIIALVSLVLLSCKEDDVPYPPTIGAAEVTVTKEAQTVTIPIVADMDILDVTMDEESEEWCSFEWRGSEIVATVQANELITRQASFSIKGSIRDGSGTLIQQGRNMKEYGKASWTIVAVSDEKVDDGGGAVSILVDDQTTFWHNDYGNAEAVLPHWVVVDMQEERQVDMVQLGWRQYGTKYYYNNKVTNVYVGNSPNHDEITTMVGSVTTLPYGGGSHASDKHKPYHNIAVTPSKGRYLKIEVAESNTGQNSIVAFVKVFQDMGTD